MGFHCANGLVALHNCAVAHLRGNTGCTFHDTSFYLLFKKVSKLFCSDLQFRFQGCGLGLLRFYYCDRKSRAACAQSFAPWQQATIEITRRDHSRCHRWQAQSTVDQVHKHYERSLTKITPLRSLYCCLFAPHT